MTERVTEEWIVILDDGKEREELLMPLCPGLILTYGQYVWSRETVMLPSRIAIYKVVRER